MKYYYNVLTAEDLPGEEWRTHPIHTEYEASNLGRIRSKGQITVSQWGRGKTNIRPVYRKWCAKVLVQHKAYNYLAVVIKKKPVFSHRFIAECWYGLQSGEMQVDHINEDKYDNRPSNLKWVTAKENVNARGLVERTRRKKWYKRGCPIYVYIVGNKVVKVAESLEGLAQYLGITGTAVCWVIRHNQNRYKDGRIEKIVRRE